MKSAHSTGTAIIVAPTGGHAKADVPHLPVTGDEVGTAAADCERIGASVLDLEPRHDTGVAEVVAAVRSRTNMLVRLATYARSETLEALLDAGADMLTCPLDAPGEFIAELRERAPQYGATVHYEARELGHLAALPPDAEHVVLVFADASSPTEDGTLAGDVETFTAALEQLPPGTTFCATGLEGASLPMMLTAIAAGGHVRVGMSDTLLYAEGTPVRDNAQLVARAAGLAKIAQRPPLPVAEARSAFQGT